MKVKDSLQSVIFEMSEYIDLQTYDEFEIYHEHYLGMQDFIIRCLHANIEKLRQYEILEIGAGTGLFTQELMKIDNICIEALDIDTRCCEFMERKFQDNDRLHIVRGDATDYTSNKKYDFIISTFAYDHIPYHLGSQLIENIFNLLSDNGVCIIGVEVIPFFSNETMRKHALMKYHSYIIDCAIRKGVDELADLEYRALISGLNKVGDFKRSHSMMLDELKAVPFLDVSYERIGPKGVIGDWGVYVYICRKLVEYGTSFKKLIS